MNPHSDKIRRIVPFVPPVLIALLLTGWLLIPREAGMSSDSVASATPSQVSETVPSKSQTFASERASQLQLIQAREREQAAPTNPAVLELADQYREGNRLVSKPEITAVAARNKGDKATLRLAGMELSGTIDSKTDSGGVILLGMTLDKNLGRFQMSLRPDDRIVASVMFTGESRAFSIKGFPENGNWPVRISTVSEILCAPVGATYPLGKGETWARRAGPRTTPPAGRASASEAFKAAPGAPVAIPVLSSLPESSYLLYLDFDGEDITNPNWNDGVTINAAPSSFARNPAGIRNMWLRIAEDFAPFDVNVTTDRALYDSTAPGFRQMCVVTTTQFFGFGGGLYGVAYLNSFGQEINCWAFDDDENFFGNDAFHGETISHEIGHTLGLRHHGNAAQEYYPGHGTGITSWAPIMGDFSQDYFQPANDDEVTSWSKGEYAGANNQQDDLEIITTLNGFGYRPDDKGNSRKTASQLNVSFGKVADSGVIERNTDTDWFSFQTSGGQLDLFVNSTDVRSSAAPQRGSNMAVAAWLYDASGRRLAVSNSQDALDASIHRAVPRGTYFLRVDGAARGTPSTGFTRYASLGNYSISGSIPQIGIIRLDPSSLDLPPSEIGASFRVFADKGWSWSCNKDWVVSVEPSTQSGNQLFEYSVKPNPGKASRSALITFRSGGFTATHQVNQAGTFAFDDHGDTIRSATLVAQVSKTFGNLELEGDVDFFRIDVTGLGFLTAHTVGDTDTFGTLYDAGGREIASDDNSDAPNFSITRQVLPGTYYVAVKHASESGVGPYQLVLGFDPSNALVIERPSSIIGAPGGLFTLQVIANGTWSWSSSAGWVTSALGNPQTGGQTLAYQVAPNPSTKRRVAEIVIRYGTRKAVHRIIQNAASADDHGNVRGSATRLPFNRNLQGRIDYEGDQDFFRIVVNASGTLSVGTSGAMDSFGELQDSSGRVLASNDNFNGANFQITKEVDAGVYFVKVRHFLARGLGRYAVRASFKPSEFVTVTYAPAGEGGRITGMRSQTIPFGGVGLPVVAVADPGYSFIRWSDGLKSPSRTETKVRSNSRITAIFVPTIMTRLPNGAVLKDNQTPPVDYGFITAGQSKSITFTIKNAGRTPLRNLRVSKSGLDPQVWSVRLSAPKAIRPGQSARLVATLKSPSMGSKSATFALRAQGAMGSFRIRVMGEIGAGSVAPSPNSRAVAGRSSGNPTPSSAAPVRGGIASPVAPPEKWVWTNENGLIRHRYRRPVGDKELPVFWISSNGITWSKASLLRVSRLSRGDRFDSYVAVFPPPNPRVTGVLVSENPPGRAQP